MSLVTLLVVLLLVGVLLWAINQMPFIDATIKRVIYVVVVVVLAVWLIQVLFGASVGAVRIGP